MYKRLMIVFIIIFYINNSNADNEFDSGKKIFLSKATACQSCHYLSENEKIDNKINLLKPDLKILNIMSVIINGKGTMPSYKDKLTYEEIKNLSYFIFKSSQD